MTIVPTIRGPLKAGNMSAVLAGMDDFQKFYRTGDQAHLFAGYRDFMSKSSYGGFANQLRAASGAHYLHNETPGVEYELKMNVETGGRKHPKLAASPIAVAESVRRTFNGLRRYLADFAVPGHYTDAHYFGNGAEIMCIEEGPPLVVKQKVEQPFLVAMPQTALVTKRKEMTIDAGTLESILRSTMWAFKNGGEYYGPCRKGRTNVDIVDTRDGRVYCATASETEVSKYSVPGFGFGAGQVLDGARLYQVEVEYKGQLGFRNVSRPKDPREIEEHIVQGIWDVAALIRRRVAHDSSWPLYMELTDQTKFGFVKKHKADRSEQVQKAHEKKFAPITADTKDPL